MGLIASNPFPTIPQPHTPHTSLKIVGKLVPKKRPKCNPNRPIFCYPMLITRFYLGALGVMAVQMTCSVFLSVFAPLPLCIFALSFLAFGNLGGGHPLAKLPHFQPSHPPNRQTFRQYRQ